MLPSPPGSCLDPDTAAGYAARGLAPEEVDAVERHIDGCASCRVLISAIASGGASAPDDPEVLLRRGAKLGPYEILEPLDAGGMGVVYRAHDARLGRDVALKAVRTSGGDRAQLLREAKVMARLAHPNVVPVYDVVEADDVYVAMELVVGHSLRQWLTAAPRTWRAIVDVFLEVGEGLAAAHAAGIVHGDVKPSNLLVGDDGRARVTDFGLATFASERGPSKVVRGTPGYLAPEQLAGLVHDARADQYAFCVSLYEALVGRLPEAPPLERAGRDASSPSHAVGTRGGEVSRANTAASREDERSRVSPSAVSRGVERSSFPRGLKRLLDRGLARDPSARFASLSDLLAALRSVRAMRARRLVLAAAVLSASVAFAWWAGAFRLEAQQCAVAAEALTSPWNVESRAQLEHSFHATQVSWADEVFTRVSARLDGWNAQFEAARAEACAPKLFGPRVEGAQLEARLACLTEAAREARGVISQLREPEVSIQLNAVAVVEPLQVSCADVAPRPVARLPDSPTRVALRDDFARFHAMMSAGRNKAGLELATSLRSRAELEGDERLRAASLVALGIAQDRTGDGAGASLSQREALRLADQIGDDRLRAQAWVSLLQAEFHRGKHERVVDLADGALGAAQRVDDAWLRSEAMLMVGGSLSSLDQVAMAKELFEQAVALRRKTWGPTDRRTAFAESALGNALAMQGDLKAAREAHANSITAAEAALGPWHPSMATLRGNLGDDFLYGLDSPAAVEELRHAADIARRNDPRSRELANLLTDLGFAQLLTGDATAASATFDEALALWEAAAPQYPLRGMAMLGRHEAGLALGQPSAPAQLEAALALAKVLPPFERGRVQAALARALEAVDLPRAKQTMKDALTGLSSAKLPLIEAERSRATAWLEAHP